MSVGLSARAPARAIAQALRRGARVFDRLGDAQTAAMMHPAKDMAADEDEVYYGEQYLHWLRPLLDTQATVLDVGCGPGRLTFAVAAALPAASVTGVDISPGALELARTYGEQHRLANVEFVETDCSTYLARQPEASIDLVLFTEVSFFMPDYKAVLAEIARVLRPGGLLFASFRSQWFNLLQSVRLRDFESARVVRDERGGPLWGTAFEFRWHTVEDAERELADLGLSVEDRSGIGLVSGREDDPLDVLARPSGLSAEQRAALQELELSLARRYPECGRYIIVTARKSPRGGSGLPPPRA